MLVRKNEDPGHLVLGLCVVSALVFVIVSGLANLNFGLTLGSTNFEKVIYSLVSVAADLFKVCLPLVCLHLWKRCHQVWASAAGVFWFFCVGFSVLSAVGFAVSSRGQVVALKQIQLEERDSWKATVKRTSTKLEELSESRSISMIEAEIDQNPVPLHIWKRTQSCLDVTIPESRKACQPVFLLRQELAAARHVERLERELVEAQSQLSTLSMVGLESDPQSAALARLSGFTETDIRTGLALLLALIIEIGSALGPTFVGLLVGRELAAPRSIVEIRKAKLIQTNFPESPLPLTPQATVEKWSLMRLDIGPGSEVPANDAFKDHSNWCQMNGLPALSQTMFGRCFTDQITVLGGRKQKRRNYNAYVGVSLQSEPAAPLEFFETT